MCRLKLMPFDRIDAYYLLRFSYANLYVENESIRWPVPEYEHEINNENECVFVLLLLLRSVLTRIECDVMFQHIRYHNDKFQLDYCI